VTTPTQGDRSPLRRLPDWAIAVAIAAAIIAGVLGLICWTTSSFTMEGAVSGPADMIGDSTYCPHNLAGAWVTVYNGEGEVIGNSIVRDPQPDYGYRCAFPFTVKRVPAYEDYYIIEITGRGRVTFSRADAEHPQLTVPY
jgi:hypothetical protein